MKTATLVEEKGLLEVVNMRFLNSQQINLLESLNSFSASYLEEKLLTGKKFNSKEEYEEAFTEFKKYVFLTQLSEDKLGMCSKLVDEVWHQFILFTPQYHQFCKKYLGKYLHHSPHTQNTLSSEKKEGAENFMRLYQGMFGEIPSIWNTSSSDCDKCYDDNCATDCSQPSCDDR